HRLGGDTDHPARLAPPVPERLHLCGTAGRPLAARAGSTVTVEGQRLPTFPAAPPANYNFQAVVQALTNQRLWSNVVLSGERGDVGYILISSWTAEAAQ